MLDIYTISDYDPKNTGYLGVDKVKMFSRMMELPKERSYFLFGARNTGKSTLIEGLYDHEHALVIDLLDGDEESRYARDPNELARQVEALPDHIKHVFVDEIQKVPKLLDIIQKLMKKSGKFFIMTGSSARKLKRGSANLLAGRAFIYHLFPLSCFELGDVFNLDQALQWGTLPAIFACNTDLERKEFLNAYSHTYLKEEILVEQVVRNLVPFRSFLEVAAQCNGQIINYSNIENIADPIDIATLPFVGDDASDQRITNALEEILDNGSAQDKEKVCLALLTSCKNSTLPDLTRQEAKSFLLRFLNTILETDGPPENAEALHDDTDQQIDKSLNKLINKKLEQIATKRKDNEYLDPIIAKRCLREGLEINMKRSRQENTEQIKFQFKEIQQIYAYLVGSERVDDQLLNDAIFQSMTGNLPRAKLIWELLIESTENNAIKEEVQQVRELLLADLNNMTDQVLGFLINEANTNKQPWVACLLGVILFKNSYCRDANKIETWKLINERYSNNPKLVLQQAVFYLSLAATHDLANAIKVLNYLINSCTNPETMILLSEIIEEPPIAGTDNSKELFAGLKEKVEQRKKEIEFRAVCISQNSQFNIPINKTIQERIALANSWLTKNTRGFGLNHNPVFMAIIILESLSKLDDPAALEAKNVMNAWLGNTNNRPWIIHQYGLLMNDYWINCEPLQEYCNQFEKHIDHLLQQVQFLTKKGDAKAAEQLIHQLIDVAIALEGRVRYGYSKITSPAHICVYSHLYRLLLNSPNVDDAYKKELTDRNQQGEGQWQKIFTGGAIPTSIIDAANTPGRRYAAFQVARIYVPFSYGAFGTLVTRPIENAEMAKNIKEAHRYFQKAADEGCLFLKDEPQALADVIKKNTELAKSYQSQKDQKKAIWHYQMSGIAGDPEAHLHYLILSDPDMKDKDTQRELGQLYLYGSNIPFVKQDIKEAQKRLESAAYHGHMDAAILVVRHYSPDIPDQLKFQPGLLNNSNNKFIEFLEIAIKLGFKQKAAGETGIPGYLKDIVDQLHPKAIEVIFNLSEKYANKWNPTEDEKQLASDLFKTAVAYNHPKALEKQNKLLEKEKKESLAVQEPKRSIDPDLTFSGPSNVNTNNGTLFGLTAPTKTNASNHANIDDDNL